MRPPSSAVFEDMVVDCWTVETNSEAFGNYVSMHPRLTIMLDGAYLNLTSTQNQLNTPASLIYIPAGMQIWSTFDQPDPFRHVDIHIKTKALARILQTDFSLMQPILKIAPTSVMSQAAELMEDAQMGQDTTTKLRAIELLKCTLSNPRYRQPSAHSESWIDLVQAHIEDNITTPLLIEDLATVAGMSRTHFNRQFRAETGMSARQWIIDRRVERAKSLIRQGRTMVEIAGLTGFSDQAHLNRTFKSVTGLPPGRWASALT
jgi:AraC-like DNA-binding protein